MRLWARVSLRFVQVCSIRDGVAEGEGGPGAILHTSKTSGSANNARSNKYFDIDFCSLALQNLD